MVPQPTCALELLGGFRAIVDGQPVTAPAAGSKLIAYLAIRERSLPRSHLAGTFWPQLSDGRAFANLRTAIWRLPTGVRSMIDATPSSMSICDTVTVDIYETRRFLHDVLDNVGSVMSSASIELLRHPLLPDWGDDWLVFERERLRQLHVHALETMSCRFLAQGELLNAVDAGAAVVRLEPLRESAHAALIRAHLAVGNRADALRCYERYRDLLELEMGLTPGEELESLVRSATQC